MKTQVTHKIKTLLIILCCTTLYSSYSQNNVETILKNFAKDYQQDITLTKNIIFGVKVDSTFWYIKAIAKTKESEAKVTVHKGKPVTPTFYYKTDIATLNKVYKGEMTALTGAAKAFSTDFAPFDADFMKGFQPTKEFLSNLMSIYFHFWTKGLPEKVNYGLEYTRFTHGAQAAILYYQPGFRSGYLAIKKGQHANKDINSRTNPFPSLFIAIEGEARIIINNKESTFKKGEAILIPSNVSHQFINDKNQPFEAFLFMFGEGA